MGEVPRRRQPQAGAGGGVWRCVAPGVKVTGRRRWPLPALQLPLELSLQRQLQSRPSSSPALQVETREPCYHPRPPWHNTRRAGPGIKWRASI